MIKNIISLLVSGIFSIALADNNTSKECVITQEILYQPIGDNSGKEVLTAKKVFKHCEEIFKTKGNCKEWTSTQDEIDIPTALGIGIEEYLSQGDLGSALATIEAINRTNAIFSGVKGYCVKGTLSDYSWLESPMFWAGIGMQIIAAAGEDKVVDGKETNLANNLENQNALEQNIDITNGYIDGTQNAVNLDTSSLATVTQDYADGLATLSQLENAQAALESSTTALGNFKFKLENYQFELKAEIDTMKTLEEGLDKALDEQTGFQKFSRFTTKGYSGCATSGALSILESAMGYIKPSQDCDPVDEFCGSEGDINVEIDPTAIQTMTLEEFEVLKTKKPDFLKAVEVIDTGATTGFVTVRFLSVGEIVDYDNLDKDSIKEAEEEAKLLKFEMEAGWAVLSIAGCMGKEAWDTDFGDKPESTTNGPDVSGKSIAQKMASSALMAILPFPYNTVATVLQNLATTWESVDSCNKEEDAQGQGQRHVKAYNGIRFNTCHATKPAMPLEKWPITGKTMRHGYEYCCYDSPISKILMVQLKSQVGKGWTHCTDVTLNELSRASFRACTANEMNPSTNGGYADGATFQGIEGVDYDMKNSYQFQHQCMNLQELQDFVESQIPVSFSQSHISEMIKDIQPEKRD